MKNNRSMQGIFKCGHLNFPNLLKSIYSCSTCTENSPSFAVISITTLSVSYPSLLAMLSEHRSSSVLVLSQELEDDALAEETENVTYLKPVRASHLLLCDNCLRHHTERWAHRCWIRPQDSRHHRPWREVWAESAAHLRHPSQVRVGCLLSTQRGAETNRTTKLVSDYTWSRKTIHHYTHYTHTGQKWNGTGWWLSSGM
jgi:hypothetical protein